MKTYEMINIFIYLFIYYLSTSQWIPTSSNALLIAPKISKMNVIQRIFMPIQSPRLHNFHYHDRLLKKYSCQPYDISCSKISFRSNQCDIKLDMHHEGFHPF